MPENVKQTLRSPGIVEERCVHSRIENATCQRCVDACPRDAWRLDDEMLGIDSDRCDGCGLCAPVCPEAALVHDHRLLSRHWKGRRLALGACERADVREPEGVVPCLHALGLTDLLMLRDQGCTTLMVLPGDCDGCDRQPVTRLEDRIYQVNRLLMSRSLPLVRLQVARPAQWRALLQETGSKERGLRRGRRDFLGGSVRRRLAAIEGIANPDECRPPGRLLPGAAPDDLMPVVPVIDAGRCDGCDACANLCPHGAVSLREPEAGRLVYRVEPADCTGCGVCVDVCECDAIRLSSMAPAHRLAVGLRSARCGRCGVSFHRPEHRGADDALCRICARVDHHRNLYQVFD